jgi:lysophospholipase L1-like esterase
MIKSKNKNYKYFLLLFLILSVAIYFICLVADFLIHRLDLWQMRDRNKIFYEMKTSARDEGFKSTNFKPVLWPKLELSEIHKDQIVHVAAQPYEKVFTCDEGYGLIKFKNDRFGFRNNDAVWDKIDFKDQTKIMFIGDSFTQGLCVGDKSTIPEKFKKYNKKIIAYNLGMSGNNSIMNALVIKTFTKVINPKYLIIIIAANDHQKFESDNIFRSQIHKENLEKKYFEKKNNSIYLSKELLFYIDERKKKFYEKKNVYFAAENRIIKKLKKYLALSNVRKKITQVINKKIFFLPSDTKTLINIANQECSINKCIPIFTFIPSSKFWENDQLQFQFKNQIEHYLTINNNIYIDLNEIIDANNKNNYAIKGGHLSPESYELISKKIYEKIKTLN